MTIFKTQNRYKADDLLVGDLIMVDEPETEKWHRRYKAKITSIDGERVRAKVFAMHDLEHGGEVKSSTREPNKGDLITCDASHVFRVHRIDGEDI
jgi:hypothetical protein